MLYNVSVRWLTPQHPQTGNRRMCFKGDKAALLVHFFPPNIDTFNAERRMGVTLKHLRRPTKREYS